MEKVSIPLEVLKMASIIILLGLPPWLNLSKYIKNRVNKILWVLIFIIYLIGTVRTQSLIPFIVVLITFIFMRKSGDESILYYFRPLRDKKSMLIKYAVLFKIVTFIIDIIFVKILITLGVKIENQEISDLLLKVSGIKMIGLSILTVVIAPILEEFVFRHILYRGLSYKFGNVISCIFTSLLFMLLHFNVAGSIVFFLVGVYNCYLYDKYGYRAAVLNHFVFNSISIIVVILTRLSAA